MSEQIVYLNGELSPVSEAKVSVLDRGFIYGDGIYDVIPMYARKAFRGPQHLARLSRSLKMIGIENPYNDAGWMALIGKVVDANGLQDQVVYIQVTRGVAKRAHAFPQGVKPTVFIMTNPLVAPSAETVAHGVSAVSLEDKRWLNCQIKSTSLLGNVLAAEYAAENDVIEAIQFRDGFLTEGSSSNIWVVKDGALMAPPKDNLILEGIRYELLAELSQQAGIPFESRRITREEVFAADEILLTSASKEVIPIVKIDGKAIGSGKPGAVFKQLHKAYQDAKAAL